MRVIGARRARLLTVAAAVVGRRTSAARSPVTAPARCSRCCRPLCLAFLVLAIFTAVASAGGREVIPREQAVAFPVSTTTDHLGALLLAPLNIAWIVQAWMLLGMPRRTPWARPALGLRAPDPALDRGRDARSRRWSGWLAEGVRRGPHGIAIFRTVVVAARAPSPWPWS